MTPKSYSGMANVRANGDFTDFAILCEEERIDVHRVIISGKSSVFYRACTSRFSEATSRTYTIDDYPLAIVSRMVEYMYTDDYSDPDKESTTEDNTDGGKELPVLFLHTAMAALADKYDIQGLIALATEKYTKCLAKNRDFAKFLDSIPNIYHMPAEASRPLREAAVEFARAEIRTAMDHGDSWHAIQEVLDDFPDFSKELLCSVLLNPLMPLEGHCGQSCTGWGKRVSVEALQCRCKKCGKGGARITTEKRGPWVW
ncbi:BTB domain-containing protein [Fusarium sp. Ph1]|nr:BTB domain-containing protein [Fusarium sp. Ph1]